MELGGLHHVTAVTGNAAGNVDFYTRVLGLRAQTFGEGRRALVFGRQKVNLHQAGREFTPRRSSLRLTQGGVSGQPHRWHFGHQKLERPPSTRRFTVPPQAQGLPSRP